MVSVIIPTYNRENTLYDAARSVLDQTWRDLELIIVDDGSTDNTAGVVASLNDARVRYIKMEKNSGACAARNRGIDASKGGFIAFHDSDDIWHADKLEKQMAYLEKTGADIVFAGIARYPLGAVEPNYFPYTNPVGLCTKEEMFRDLLNENTVSMVTVLCRRDCAIEVPLDESLPRRQDWDWAMRAAQRYCMRYQDEVLVDSYAQADSISYSTAKHVDALRIIQHKYQKIISSDPVLDRQWAVRMADALFSAGQPAFRACLRAFIKTRAFKPLVKAAVCLCGLQKAYLSLKKG